MINTRRSICKGFLLGVCLFAGISIFFAGTSFSEPQLKLIPPYAIQKTEYFDDGGTIGIVLKDADQREIKFLLSPTDQLFYGGFVWSKNGVKPVAIKSSLEIFLLEALQNAIDQELSLTQQKELLTDSPNKPFSKIEEKCRLGLIALDRYRRRREILIAKEGRADLEYVNTKNGYRFRYPVTWDATELGIQKVEASNGGTGMGIVAAHIYVLVEEAQGLTLEQWYANFLRKYKHDLTHYKQSPLPVKVAGEPAIRFWNPVLDGGTWITIDQMIVFKKQGHVYAVNWINQFLGDKEFEDALNKVVETFQVSPG